MTYQTDPTMLMLCAARLLFRMRRTSDAARIECKQAVKRLHLTSPMALRPILRGKP